MSELKDKMLLVVEDNVDNYTLILRILTTMGVEHCTWISSGWKVAEEVQKVGKPDLILLDINLPYEDGFKVHKKLREHPRLKDTLIVAVTANASEDYMQKAINEGLDGFIGKPIDPDRFPDQINRIFSGVGVWEWH